MYVFVHNKIVGNSSTWYHGECPQGQLSILQQAYHASIRNQEHSIFTPWATMMLKEQQLSSKLSVCSISKAYFSWSKDANVLFVTLPENIDPDTGTAISTCCGRLNNQKSKGVLRSRQFVASQREISFTVKLSRFVILCFWYAEGYFKHLRSVFGIVWHSIRVSALMM